MRNLRVTVLAFVLVLTTVLGSLAPGAALAQSSDAQGSDAQGTTDGKINVVRKVLDNGLEVLVVPRPGTGVAIADVWVGVGSINETPKNNGVAHFFEHMVFKGTPTRPVGSIDLAVDAMGGSNNAATSYDWTHYYIEAPSPKIDDALGILADMTYNAAFPQAEIDREKEVVLRERDMDENDPQSYLYDQFIRAFYQKHPYGMPTIGTAEGLDPQQQKDFLKWRDTYYVPNNMTLVVVGDVNPDEVLKSVESQFGSKPAGELPKLDLPKDVGPQSVTVKEIERDVNQGYLMMGWPAPEIEQRTDVYAMDVLLNVLSGGRNSRFYQNIYKKLGIVNDVSASYYTTKDPSVFQVTAQFPYENRAAVEQAILAELQKILDGKLSAEEVARAKTILLSDVALNDETNSGLAQTLGFYAKVAGDYNFGLTYPEGVRAVTVDDVVNVARKYIDPKKYLELVLVPKDAKAAPGAQAAVTSTVTSTVTGPLTTTLDNGLQVILQPDPNTEVVAFHTLVAGGRAAESADQAGITNLTQQLLLRGTTTRNEEQLFGAFEDLGAKVGGTALPDAGDVALTATRETWQDALPLYLDVLLNPAFNQEEFDRLKADTLKNIAASKDDLWTVTVNNFRKGFFGPGGYGNPDLGTTESVGKLTLDDVKAYYHKYFVPNNMVVSVAGNFDPAVMEAQLRAGLGKVPEGEAVTHTPPTVSIAENKEVTTTAASGVSYLILAYPAPAASSRDLAAMKVLNTLAGGGMSSRLFTELRDKQGLAYSTGSQFSTRAGDNAFVAYIIALPENAEKGYQGILQVLADIRDKGVTDEELDRAKSKELGNFLLSQETADSRALDSALNTVIGTGLAFDEKYPDMIRAVTKEDVQRVAEKYLQNYVISRLDPAK